MNNDMYTNEIRDSCDKVTQMQRYWKENDPDYHVLISYLLPQMEEIGRDYPAKMWPELILMNYKLIKKIIHDLFENKTISGSYLASKTFH